MKTNFIENNKRFSEQNFFRFACCFLCNKRVSAPLTSLCRAIHGPPTLSLQTDVALGALSHVPLLHAISCNDVDRNHYTKLRL